MAANDIFLTVTEFEVALSIFQSGLRMVEAVQGASPLVPVIQKVIVKERSLDQFLVVCLELKR